MFTRVYSRTCYKGDMELSTCTDEILWRTCNIYVGCSLVAEGPTAAATTATTTTLVSIQTTELLVKLRLRSCMYDWVCIIFSANRRLYISNCKYIHYIQIKQQQIHHHIHCHYYSSTILWGFDKITEKKRASIHLESLHMYMMSSKITMSHHAQKYK